MTLKWWKDPCNCALIDGFTCNMWKNLFKVKCKQDDEETSFALSLVCCPCSFVSLLWFLPCIACKEYQVYHTIKDTQDVLIVEQPIGYHSITKEEVKNTSINAPEEPNDHMNESLYYEKSKPIPIIIKKTGPRLTLI